MIEARVSSTVLPRGCNAAPVLGEGAGNATPRIVVTVRPPGRGRFPLRGHPERHEVRQ